MIFNTNGKNKDTKVWQISGLSANYIIMIEWIQQQLYMQLIWYILNSPMIECPQKP